MFKTTQEVSVLGICLPDATASLEADGLNFASVNSGRRAIDMLRMLRFDLLLIGPKMPDISVWEFVRRARVGWPWQKWCLVSEGLTEQQEITARMMGVTKIFEVMPGSDELNELTSRLRDRAERAVLNGKYENVFEPIKLRSAL